MRKRILISTLAVALAFLASMAPAATIVDTWSYKNYAAFTSWQNEYLGGNQTGIYTADAETYGPRTLYWGNSNPNALDRSRITIGPSVNGTNLQTDGDTVNVVQATHYNQSISSLYTTLGYAVITATVEFSPYNPSGVFNYTHSADLQFAFFETTNLYGENDYPNDIFVLINFSDTTNSFIYDGYKYTYSFSGDGFRSIAEWENDFGKPYTNYLEALNVDDLYGLQAYVGWVTTEGNNTTAQFKLSITSEPVVPEPSTALLLGAGLLGLGLFARRRS